MVTETEELEKNKNVLKQLQDLIVHMKAGTDFYDQSELFELLEETVVRISRLEKGLDYVLNHFVYDLDMKIIDEDELKWIKSLVEKGNGNDNNS